MLSICTIHFGFRRIFYRFTTVFFCIYRKSIYLTSRKYSIFAISLILNALNVNIIIMIFEFYYHLILIIIGRWRLKWRGFFLGMEKFPMIKLWNWMCTGINYRVHLEINLMDKYDVRVRTGADVCAVVQFCWFCETFARYLLFEATRLW